MGPEGNHNCPLGHPDPRESLDCPSTGPQKPPGGKEKGLSQEWERLCSSLLLLPRGGGGINEVLKKKKKKTPEFQLVKTTRQTTKQHSRWTVFSLPAPPTGPLSLDR